MASEIRQTSEWTMALRDMEQMHPRYLVELVENGTLATVLDRRVEAFLGTVQRMTERAPNLPYETIVEIAQHEHLLSENPDWEDEQPLSKEEKAALTRYLKDNR